jgi:hypothetical protein
VACFLPFSPWKCVVMLLATSPFRTFNAWERNVEDYVGYPLVSGSCFTDMSHESILGGCAWARIPSQSCVLNLVCFRSIPKAPYARDRAPACLCAIVHSLPLTFTCSMSLSTVLQAAAKIDVMWHDANLGADVCELQSAAQHHSINPPQPNHEKLNPSI